jgi:hypothetical protein
MMAFQDTNRADAETLALSALGWVLSDEDRARRLLETTGLTPDQLRAGLGDPAMLAALLRFLEAHEPDLVACAEAIDASPGRLVDARRSLEKQA